MQKVIALDIGGVCIQLRHKQFLSELGLASLPEEVLRLNQDFECGHLQPEQWLQQNRRLLPQISGISDQSFWTLFRSIIGPEQPGMASLCRAWSQDGYTLVFFSNTSSVHADEIQRKISFAKLISDAVYSYECKAMKPNPKIYQDFEDKFGRPVLYLDDLPANVEQGLKMGWNAKLFEGAEKLQGCRP
ncbi:MAG: hypothetical protein WCS95_07830 [Lentisphaeria bacterium]|jgi:FMN phosphatase YigB (HAD superfamily)|nr:hypothetical protein [Lentisphaeria bacterium]NLZ59752.1 hypothetical protein [Lentisphaerota bacterium]